METFALYLFKSSVWLTGFSLIYFLFLRNERFFVLNRIFLVTGIVISILFPLFTWHYTVIFPVTPTVDVLEPEILGTIPTTVPEPFPTQNLLLYVYLIGALFLIFRLIKQTTSVLKVIRKSETLLFNSVKLIQTDRYPAPFSFFSYVFVNPSIDETETNEILNHEQEHIRQQHWIDLLLFEILCITQWFNPASWLYGHFIRQNHEYLADERAIKRSSNPAIYRAALLNQMFDGSVISLTNSFNYSLNKKRFNMMKQTISSPIRKLKLLLVLPLIAGVFYAFAAPEYKFVPEIESSPIQGNLAQTTWKTVKGKVIREDGTPLRGTSIVVKHGTNGTLSGENGVFELKVPNDTPLAFSFVGFGSQEVKPDFDKEMVITMKTEVISIDPVGNDISESKPMDIKENSSDHPVTQKKEQEVFIVVEQMPEFPGGIKALKTFVAATLKYPVIALENGIQGMVYVRFVVAENGSVTDAKIERGVDTSLDQEALRIVNSMPKWKPGLQRGMPVKVSYSIPISFKLPPETISKEKLH